MTVINQMLQTLFSMQRFEKLREMIHNVNGELASFPDMSAEIADISARIQALPAPEHENTIEAMQAEMEEISRRIAELDVVRKTGMSQSRMKQALDFTEGIRTQASVWLQNNPMIPKPEDTGGYQSLADLYRDQAAESAKSTGLKQRRAMTGAAYDRSSHTRDMLMTDVATLTGQFEDISHKLDEMPDVCHLCGGRIVNVEAYNNARCKMLTGEDTRDQFNDRMRSAIDSVKKRISDLDVQMDGLRQEMAKLDSDIALSDAVMEKHAELVPAVSRLEEHMAWARERDSKLEALKRADDDIARLNAMSVYPDDIDYQMAELTRRLQTVRGSIEDQVSRDNEYMVGIRSLDARKELLEAQMQKAELNGKVRRFLVGMRDLFSAGNAQAIYLNGRIDMLNRLIARYMTGAQMPFRLYLDKEEHVFKFETTNGFVHPSDHLSGAQKSMSAVALQMALLAVVAPNINVCILDEPAEALDVSNKVLMAGMLERMSRMLPSVDGTMLVVTRDEQIIDSCGSVIEIGEHNEEE